VSASEEWTAEARAKGKNVEFVFLGAHELLTALTSPKKPSDVVFVTDLPKNGAGKILKRELRQLPS
jgi:acyl-CoA synthetase (AMP-forming)/AMP-acid ligase II